MVWNCIEKPNIFIENILNTEPVKCGMQRFSTNASLEDVKAKIDFVRVNTVWHDNAVIANRGYSTI